MSHTLDIQHFVFGTRGRQHTIRLENREALYRFIWSKLKEMKCHLYRINGIGDHVHIVVDLHPDISKAELIRVLKTSSSQCMKKMRFISRIPRLVRRIFFRIKGPVDTGTCNQLCQSARETSLGRRLCNRTK